MVKITKLMLFSADARLKRIGRKVVEAYPERFGRIKLDRIGFYRETTGLPAGAVATCNRVPILWRQVMGRKLDWVIVFFDCACKGKSRRYLQLVMFHELLHIGPLGGVVEHDIEDFALMLRALGVDWGSGDELPDIVQSPMEELEAGSW